MNQIVAQPHTLSAFGSSIERVDRAVAQLRAGKGILVVDDEDRENEGDIIFAADTLTVEQMAMLIRECSGIVCLCMTDEKLRKLDLPQMVDDNTSSMGTGFTVSIEAKEGVTTGVSAADRVTTVKTAVAQDCQPWHLAKPGHVFPLRARTGGVLVRRGHTEATIDLVTMAGHSPAGVLCELTNPDGTMARLPEIIAFGRNNDMPVVSIEDIVKYRALSQAQAV